MVNKNNSHAVSSGATFKYHQVHDGFRALERLQTANIDEAGHWAALIEDTVAMLPADKRMARADALAALCTKAEPLLAYELGRQRFMGVDLIAEPGVAVPRPVTERVGRAALRLIARFRATEPQHAIHVVDMCGGSGNLACALALYDHRCHFWSCDVNPAASDLARRNAEMLGVADRVTVRTGDLFGALDGDRLRGAIDIVLCAPPFISTARLGKDRAHLLEHEPREAFEAGPYGLTFHQRTAREAVPFLRPGGHIVLEAGEGQSRQVGAVLKRARIYEEIEVVDEGDGAEFVVQARRQAADPRQS
jgi:release factor glutamine methyltransferase